MCEGLGCRSLSDWISLVGRDEAIVVEREERLSQRYKLKGADRFYEF